MEYFETITIIIMFVGSYVGIWFLGYYIGKKNYNKPIQPEEEENVKKLFEDLKNSIINEDYEEAAKIRDKLKKNNKKWKKI